MGKPSLKKLEIRELYVRPNIFGVAFAEAGYRWTKVLCEADTDNDGQTNGFELGDPQCCFVDGRAPHYDFSLSHPGDVTSTSARKIR